MTYYVHTLATESRQEMKDITHLVRESVAESGVTEGIAFIFCHHTTAALTINENADPDVKTDIIKTLNKIFPVKGAYSHLEGNSHAHIKSSLIGSSQSVIIKSGKLVLGTWQSIFFCEFDGPRTRKISVKIIPC